LTAENLRRIIHEVVVDVVGKKRSHSKSTISSKGCFDEENRDQKLHASSSSSPPESAAQPISPQEISGEEEFDAPALVEATIEPSGQLIGLEDDAAVEELDAEYGSIEAEQGSLMNQDPSMVSSVGQTTVDTYLNMAT